MPRCHECNRVVLQGRIDELSTKVALLRAELAAVAESEVYFRTLYETTVDSVLLIDEKGVFDCNPATLNMFRAPSKDYICSRTTGELSPPFQPCGTASEVLADEHIQTAMANGIHCFEWLSQRSDGVEFLAQVSLIAIEIQGRKVLQCTARDLTEQKRYEADILQAQQETEAANMELKRALEELDRLASTDQLTGAWNRRFFNQMITAETDRAQRYQQPLSVVILDVDHFKSVNDRYGHPAGDAVLAEFGRLLSAHIRSSDYLVRWGGEEFMVLMPSTPIEAANAMADKLRTLVEDHAFPYAGKVSISLGVAQFGVGEAISQWLSRADNALYKAKQQGRNTVVCA